MKTGLADVIRKLEAGELAPKVATALVYAYSTLAGIMANSNLETRIEQLERARAAEERDGRLAS